MECKLERELRNRGNKKRINRNIVECKLIIRRQQISTRTRINRNIVECKSIPLINRIHFQARINRNIVECKSGYSQTVFITGGELIETLWNVNKNTMELKEIESIELIETLWNVNLAQAVVIKKGVAN